MLKITHKHVCSVHSAVLTLIHSQVIFGWLSTCGGINYGLFACVCVCVQVVRQRGGCCQAMRSSWSTMNPSVRLLENESSTSSGGHKKLLICHNQSCNSSVQINLLKKKIFSKKTQKSITQTLYWRLLITYNLNGQFTHIAKRQIVPLTSSGIQPFTKFGFYFSRFWDIPFWNLCFHPNTMVVSGINFWRSQNK